LYIITFVLLLIPYLKPGISAHFYYCYNCGDQIPDPTGKKVPILTVRRDLFAKNPEMFKEGGEISTANLGGKLHLKLKVGLVLTNYQTTALFLYYFLIGDSTFATPKKKRTIEFDSDSEGDDLIAGIVEIQEKRKEKKAKGTTGN